MKRRSWTGLRRILPWALASAGLCAQGCDRGSEPVSEAPVHPQVPPSTQIQIAGSWSRDPTAHGREHLVLRPDGTGYRGWVLGTRVDVVDVSWQTRGDTLVLAEIADVPVPQRGMPCLVRRDSLGVVFAGIEGRDTAWFHGGIDPRLVRDPGEKDLRLVGNWSMSRPHLERFPGIDGAAIVDTSWMPQELSFRLDGTGRIVDHLPGLVCPDADSTLDSCVSRPIARDPVEVTWWTAGAVVYTSPSGGFANPGGVVDTLVWGWRVEGDSLELLPFDGEAVASARGRRAP